MPEGSLVTVPSPFPCLFTVSVTRSGGATGLNVAVTDRFVSMVTEQEPGPLQSPPQELKVELARGVAVNVTMVPRGKTALQVVAQA
jgi:hypothetical protein